MLTNFLQLNNIKGAVVLAKADIQYLKPINGDILAHCSLPEANAIKNFKTTLTHKNRAKIALTIEVKEQNIIKAKMIGQFAIV